MRQQFISIGTELFLKIGDALIVLKITIDHFLNFEFQVFSILNFTDCGFQDINSFLLLSYEQVNNGNI